MADNAPSEAEVRVMEVDPTLAELIDIHASISADRANGTLDGAQVHSIGLDLPGNRVTIGTADASSHAVWDLRSRYGDAVAVEASEAPAAAACNSRGDCASPLKGGLNVNIGGEACSSGFVSRDGTEYFLLSAGHCGVMGSAWTHHSVQYGTTHRRAYYDGSSADASAAKIVSSQKSNRVFRTVSNYFSVTANADGGSVGDLICLSARYLSSYDCGYIEDNYYETTYEGRTFWDQTRATSIDGQGGQSGGAIFVLEGGFNVSAAGLMTATQQGGTYIIYSKIDNVQAELGLNTCKNMACN